MVHLLYRLYGVDAPEWTWRDARLGWLSWLVTHRDGIGLPAQWTEEYNYRSIITGLRSTRNTSSPKFRKRLIYFTPRAPSSWSTFWADHWLLLLPRHARWYARPVRTSHSHSTSMMMTNLIAFSTRAHSWSTVLSSCMARILSEDVRGYMIPSTYYVGLFQ